MKKTLLLGGLTALLFVQCGKDSDPFLIKKDAIGNLTEHTKMKQLDSIFSADSIVKTNSSPNALETQGEVEIYEKGGQKLLLLSPKNETDPNSTITDVLVFDPRYKTEKGVGLSSTFKDFRDNYTVSNIHRIINGILVFFSDTNIYLTIDAKNLPEEIRYNPEATIDASQIPDSAPIKYFRIGWEAE
ncbi:hypothetical protein EI546_14000 [Aequorivita sp. H23M31]|uniref:Uncharacterized protein n=1 Tax=Aequorivita ciconiae TaxID=2494375 RepID=A0A410G6A9_9FLAO|nr:hypothetical protein [Aequorivita sp. H23M31]QAA82761.1 hypothetical protein EI546_14000 [Aequorivita sp. H23M31]